MKKQLIILFIFTGILACTKSIAQFSVQGEFRPRAEYRNGYKLLRDTINKPAFFVSQRTRLIFNYASKNLVTKINLQDVRTWGEEKFKADIAAEAVHEAWVNIRLVDSFWLKIGRQELIYDNERLLSNNNWQQASAVHDAAVFKYVKKGWTVDACFAFNQQSDSNNFTTDYTRADVRGNYKTLDFLWITKKYKNFNFQFAGIMDGYQQYNAAKKTYLRYTYGPVIGYAKNDFGITARAFLQSGKTQDGKEISAYFANADINYLLFKKLNLVAGFELWSGYDFTDSTSKKVNAFDLLYGTGHKFNGNMDYFTKPADTKNAGLLDGYLFLTYKLNKKLSAKLDYHYFALASNYGKKGGTALDKGLGNEFDFSLKMDFSKDVSLNFGYSTIFATTSMEAIKSDKKKNYSGGDHSKPTGWGFVMLTIKPDFFKL